MAWTKTDGSTVSRIGRVVAAEVIEDDYGYFVRAQTAQESYDGPYFETLGDAARKTGGLPLEARQKLYAGLSYP